MLRAIRIGYAVLGACKLLLQFFSALFSLLFPRFRLDDIRKLDYKVELSAGSSLVHSVKQRQLPKKPLER